MIKTSINFNVLVERLDQLEAATGDLYLLQELDLLRDKLAEEIFNIVVVGHFSSGKSTFINALLGRKLLPSSASETTAVSTKVFSVANSSEKTNTIYVLHKDGVSDVLNIDSEENKLEQYISMVKGDKDVISNIDRVEVFLNTDKFPTEICIVDTPGANGLSPDIFEKTKLEIKNAAAVIYIVPNRGFADTDKQFLNYISQFQDKLFIVLNQIDLIAEEERQEMKRYIQLQVEQLIGVKKPDVYMVSSMKTLEAREANDEHLAELWGFTQLEQAITSFIHNNEYTTTYVESITRQIDQISNEVDILLNRINDDKVANNRQLEKYMQYARKKYLNLERDIIRFIDDFNMKLFGTFEPVFSEIREYELTELNKLLYKQVSARNQQVRITEHVNMEQIERLFIELEQTIEQQALEAIEGYSNKVNNFLEEQLASVKNRNTEITMLILDVKNNSVNYSYIEQASIEIQAADFLFTRWKKDELKQELHQFHNDIVRKREIEEYLEKIRRELELCKDKSDGLVVRDERIYQTYINDRNRLGSKPDIERWEEEYEVKRGGILGLFGMTKTKVRTRSDDSKRVKWDRDIERIEEGYQGSEQSLKQEKQQLEMKMKRIKQEMLVNKSKEKELDEQISEVLFELLEKLLNSSKQYVKEITEQLKQHFNSITVSLLNQLSIEIGSDRDHIVHIVRQAVRLELDELEKEKKQAFIS